jgi:hypothetical protein
MGSTYWGLNNNEVPKDIINSLGKSRAAGPISILPALLESSNSYNCILKKNCPYTVTKERNAVFNANLVLSTDNIETYTIHVYKINGWMEEQFNSEELSYRNRNVLGNSFCVTNDLGSIYEGTDEFTIQIYIGASMFINKEDNIDIIQSAVYSGNLKYIVTKYYRYNLKTLKYNPEGNIATYYGRRGEVFSRADVNLTKGILQQMFNVTYIFRERYKLTHGNLTTSNIMVDDQPYKKSIKINGVKVSIDCPVTVRVSNFSSSSYSLDGSIYRFFNKGSLSNLYVRSISFTPNVKNISNEYVYKINNFFISQVIIDYKHRGISYYRSFDLYIFIITLFIQDEFYNLLLSDVSINNMFKSIFFYTKDYDKVMKRLPKYIDNPSLDNAISLLKGSTLYCDIWKKEILDKVKDIGVAY